MGELSERLRSNEPRGPRAARDVEELAEAADRIDELERDLDALIAALPPCVHVEGMPKSPRSCPRVATKGPQDFDDDFFGNLWCDEHAPTERDIEDCGYPEDLPWAPLVRRLWEKR